MFSDWFGQKNRKRYAEMLRFEHRWFDVKGLTTQSRHTLELEKVYVELRIATEQFHKATMSTFVDKKRDGQHIWNYMTAYERPIVILGPPGSGKTTLLRSMVLQLLNKRTHSETGLPGSTIPVFLHLRDLVDPISSNPDSNLADIINHHLEQIRIKLEKGSDTPQNRPPDDWIDRQIKNNRGLIVLDGLDEVADSLIRRQIVAWVQGLTEKHPDNRFVITSRPGGYIANPLKDVTSLEVQGFNQEQQRQFVHNWYLQQEISSTGQDDAGVRGDARIGADDLLERINRSNDLSSLAINPLTLTMIANVHRFRNQLPGKRVELYAEICDVFLGQWRLKKGFSDGLLSSAQKIHVLQPLAFHMMVNNTREVELKDVREIIGDTLREVDQDLAPANFIQIIQEGSGLLIEKEWHLYSFSHKTFQEYLSARYIGDNLDYVSVLVNHVSDPWWHETIRLYAAQNDATEIIKACIRAIDMDDIDGSTAPLELGIVCLEERLSIDPQVESEFRQMVEAGVEGKHHSLNNYFRHGLLNMRLSSMIQVSSDLHVDRTPISRAEYQLFITERSLANVEHQPDQWDYSHFKSSTGNEAISGIRPFDAIEFTEWLTTSQNSAWVYRLPTVEELKSVPDPDQPFWVLNQNNKALSTRNMKPYYDYRVAFANAVDIIEKAITKDDDVAHIFDTALISEQLIKFMDVEQSIMATHIDDQFMELAGFLIEPNIEMLGEVNEMMIKRELPYRRLEKSAGKSARYDTQEIERLSKQTLGRLNKEYQQRKDNNEAVSRADSIAEIEYLGESCEKLVLNIGEAFQIGNVDFTKSNEYRQNSPKNVRRLSLFLNHARRRAVNLVYGDANHKHIVMLNYIKQFEDFGKPPPKKMNQTIAFALSKLIPRLSKSSDYKEKILGLLGEATIRNAAIWNLLNLVGIYKKRQYPRRVIMQQFIRIICVLLLINIEKIRLSENGKNGSKSSTWTFSNSNSSMSEYGGVATKALLDVYRELIKIEENRKKETELETIMLVKELKFKLKD